MKTKDAISRLSFTISKGNKPNDSDKEALNAVIKFINKSDQNAVNENEMFAKLYTFLLCEFLTHYQDVNVANVEVNNVLSKPIQHHVEILMLKMKQIEMEAFFKDKGIVDTLVTKVPLDEAVDRYEANKAIFPTINTAELKETLDMWDYENTRATLNRNIHESITRYKNV